MAKKEKFIPAWYEEATPAGSWRSIFKWGDPAAYKHPNSGLTKLIMDRFDLSRELLSKPCNCGLEQVEESAAVSLDPEHLAFLSHICV